ncbi:MAG: hypothetical protein IPL84_13105 [Chitinophagaceae bacterium]|nr:hypothetical protein [Chitinophagaceae bacterium]
MVDRIKANYTLAATVASYSLAGKYSSRSNFMIGTIGLGSISGVYGEFSVTKN